MTASTLKRSRVRSNRCATSGISHQIDRRLRERGILAIDESRADARLADDIQEIVTGIDAGDDRKAGL